jgi:hypothetical protein
MSFPRIALAVGATVLVSGLACSTSSKRDQFYGTDVGVNWTPPDATVRDTAGAHDAGVSDGAEAGADAGDAAPSADAPASDTL